MVRYWELVKKSNQFSYEILIINYIKLKTGTSLIEYRISFLILLRLKDIA